jgi:hypothetical protein
MHVVVYDEEAPRRRLPVRLGLGERRRRRRLLQERQPHHERVRTFTLPSEISSTVP